MGLTCILTPMTEENVPSPNNISSELLPQSLKKGKFKEIAKEVVLFIIIAFGIILPFRLYIAEPYLVDGKSMDPTFDTGDYLIVDKISYKFNEPERNSVIIFRYPGDTKKSFIKRIIGLPGETVIVGENSTRIVNKENPLGFFLDQFYVAHTSGMSYEATLFEDEYFVMGDNRAESFDSRFWGPLQKKYILGKPIIRLFPLNKIEVMPGEIK